MKNAAKTHPCVHGICMLLFLLVTAGLAASGAGEGYLPRFIN